MDARFAGLSMICVLLAMAGCIGEAEVVPDINGTAGAGGGEPPSQPASGGSAAERPTGVLPGEELPAAENKRPAPVPCRLEEPWMECIGNARYGNESEFQVLDLYMPKNASGPLPVVIHVHGGGWAIGEKGGGPLGLVSEGYAIAEVEYRLSQEAKFPAQADDVKAAVRWLRANAAEYGLDGDRFGIIGESAGGHLASLAGTSGNSPAFGGEAGVHAVVDYYGPVDFNSVAGAGEGDPYWDYASFASMLIGGGISSNPAVVASANPISYVDSEDPPFLIIHGTNDSMIPYDESLMLYRALRDAGVNATLIAVEGGEHGGFSNQMELDARVEEFFRDALGGT